MNTYYAKLIMFIYGEDYIMQSKETKMFMTESTSHSTNITIINRQNRKQATKKAHNYYR